MANAPLKICSGCRKKFTRDARCPACMVSNPPNKRTSGSTDPFYQSRAWKDLRAAYIAAFPLCCDCESRGFTEPGYIVDHVVERADDLARELDWNNLQTLCLSCHSRKTRLESTKRKRRL